MDFLAATPYTICTSYVALAAGSTSTLSSTGTINFSIGGKAYSAAALSSTATPTTDAATGAAFLGVKAGYGSIFIVGLNASGGLVAVQGTIEALDASGAFVRAPNYGAIPNNFCPIGYLIIKAGASADATTGWVFGTSNVAAVTGITYTFGNLMGLPARPIIS